MKSRKQIATMANDLVAEFKEVGPIEDALMFQIVKTAEEKLSKRQIAPQKIMEEFVLLTYQVLRKRELKINEIAFQVLKRMEKLSRERSFLPFKRYDPWN